MRRIHLDVHSASGTPTVALLDSADVIEDTLTPLGMSLDDLRVYTGSWVFGYVHALHAAGVRTILIFVSRQVTTPTRAEHGRTGATIWYLPSPPVYRLLRGRALGWKPKDTLRRPDHTAALHLRALGAAFRRVHLARYLATPIAALAGLLRREGCAALICQEYESGRFDACALLGSVLGIPVLATYQSGQPRESILEKRVRRLAIRSCAGLIISARTEAHRVLAEYGVTEEKIARIRTPMDLNGWDAIDRREARATLDLPLEAHVAVWHGRVEIEKKGLDVLVDAWNEVCRARDARELRLLLVGTGKDADALGALIRDKRLPGVVWINEFVLERTELTRYLSAGDVYVFPSRYEGFPMSPVEAMGCRLPVIASDAPGVIDVLEGAEGSVGMVVPTGDATALAAALGAALDDRRLAHDLGRRARGHVEQRFAVDVVGQQLRDFILQGRAGSVPSRR